MIITFTGDLGSGKSTVCKMLQEHGFKRISIGDTWRQYGAEKGLSLPELNRIVTEEMDIEMDERTAERAREAGDCVVEGRAQWHFLPESFKVFLAVDEIEGARRIYAAKRESEKENESFMATLMALRARRDHDAKRFRRVYGIDIRDPKNYDLVIDTTSMAPQDVVERILLHCD